MTRTDPPRRSQAPSRRRTATTRMVSQVNRTILLDTLRESGPMSRQRIIDETGLSPATVNRLLDALKAENLVTDGEREASRGGRPAQLVRFNAQAQSILALALGSGTLHGAVCDLAGNIRERHSLPLRGKAQDGEPATVLEQVIAFATGLAQSAHALGAPPRAVAVGVPGVATGQDGFVEFAPALGWSSMPLGARLTEELGVPAVIENDVNLIALAAHRHAVEPGVQHLVALVADVGVGAGLVLGGRLHRGRLGAAGEVGYLLMERRSLDRTWPGFGDLESSVGLHGIRSRIAEHGGSDEPGHSALEHLFADARRGEPRASGLVRQLADDFALVVADIAVLLSPEVVVLGGRTFQLGGDLLTPAVESRLQGRIPLVPRLTTVDSDELQLIGAAEFAREATAGSASLLP
ncbi:ROK family protein [Streptomyces sp. NPDC004111]|uniref:ROK family transcriptional regulator n=1 Tax=Streptomyces sp. NPDC004111 TaxID=3364690 RepID=UPI00367A6D94